jgi:hypothetical protein
VIGAGKVSTRDVSYLAISITVTLPILKTYCN